MAIKIPGDTGLGTKTPGVIAEGTPRPVKKIRTDIGLEIAQGVTRLAGVVAGDLIEKQAKADKAAHDEMMSGAKIESLNIQAEVVQGSKDIVANKEYDVERKQQEFSKLLEKAETDFTDRIPEDARDELAPAIASSSINAKLKFDESITAQVNNQRVANMEKSLLEIEDFSFANPGHEADIKANAHILIDASPESATAKVKRKANIDNVIDTNAVRNEIALGDPEVLLKDLNKRTEGGSYAKYKGMSAANRTLYTKQARDAVIVKRGQKIANDLWEGPKGPQDKFDLIDVEDMTETARKRASTEAAAKVAVTRIRERATLHNQARAARITSNQATIWEAHDKGAKSTAIYKMAEFVELPAPQRMEIENTLSRIAEAAIKKDTLALKNKQLEYFDKLSQDAGLLLETDLLADHRERKITDGQYTSLRTMQKEGSLKAEKMKEAHRILIAARDANLFDKKTIENSRQYAATVEKVHEFGAANPEGDPLEFVDGIINPKKESWVMDLLDTFTARNYYYQRFVAEDQEPAQTAPPIERPKVVSGTVLDDEDIARRYINQAGGDRDKARELARQDGYTWEIR